MVNHSRWTIPRVNYVWIEVEGTIGTNATYNTWSAFSPTFRKFCFRRCLTKNAAFFFPKRRGPPTWWKLIRSKSLKRPKRLIGHLRCWLFLLELFTRYPVHTVDGLEIPFPTTWDGAKTLWILGYLLHQLVSRISEPSTSVKFKLRISGCCLSNLPTLRVRQRLDPPKKEGVWLYSIAEFNRGLEMSGWSTGSLNPNLINPLTYYLKGHFLFAHLVDVCLFGIYFLIFLILLGEKMVNTSAHESEQNISLWFAQMFSQQKRPPKNGSFCGGFCRICFFPGSIVGFCRKISLLKETIQKAQKTVLALLPVFRVTQTKQIPCGRNYAWWYSWSWLICRRKVIERAGFVGQKNVFENVDLWIWALTGFRDWFFSTKKGVPAFPFPGF